MRKQWVIGLAAALNVWVSATTANAETPFTAGKLQLGGVLNVGTNMDDEAPNPYGFGLGVDFGGTTEQGVHLGVEFNYFFGSTEEESGVETSVNAMQYGVEFGYDAGVSSDMVIRPKLGIGVASVSTGVGGSDYVGSESDGGLFIPVGVAVLISLDGGFIGGDFRYGISPHDSEASALLIGLGAGAAF